MRSDPRHHEHLFPGLVDRRSDRQGPSPSFHRVGGGGHCHWPGVLAFERGRSSSVVAVCTVADNGLCMVMAGIGIALLPVVVMPTCCNGPGAPGLVHSSTMNALEDPGLMPSAIATPGTVQRGILWSIATAAMFPLGREGPVVQVGAAVARAIHRRWGQWLPSLNDRQMVAIGGGAGLAGGFNTPLLGAVFMLEELTTDYAITTIWPALVISVAAAGFSNLGGQPIFCLGVINVMTPEPDQLLMALPIGVAGGIVGGLFSRGLVWATGRISPMVQRYPIRTGLCLGSGLCLLALTTWGTSTGDGESLLRQLIQEGMPNGNPDGGSLFVGLSSLWITAGRVIGPMLPLAPGVPGGLIDPSLTFGGLLGYTICAVLGFSQHLGIA